MLTDGNNFHCQWSMGRITAVYPGRDNMVRAIDVQMETAVIPAGCHNKEQLVAKIKTKTSILRRPITKVALLLAAEDLPEQEANVALEHNERSTSFHGGENMFEQELP